MPLVYASSVLVHCNLQDLFGLSEKFAMYRKGLIRSDVFRVVMHSLHLILLRRAWLYLYIDNVVASCVVSNRGCLSLSGAARGRCFIALLRESCLF